MIRGLPVLALAVTLGLGVWMRWALAGHAALALPFDHLRHAHSHAGAFGVLFPLAWLGWRAAGAPAPGPRAQLVYALATMISVLGFLRAGYGPIAIAGSTAVAAVWLISAWRIRGRMSSLWDPLGGVPLGVVLALACVPPIAWFLRRDPDLAHGFVGAFLSGLLLLVVVPSALAGRGVSAGPWPLTLAAGALGALALGPWPSWPGRLGLAFTATALMGLARSDLPTHLRLTWVAAGVGLAALAAGVVPNNRPVGLGAIHFLVLGPILGTLAPRWLPRELPTTAWWIGHALAGGMGLALVAQGMGLDLGISTWTASAVFGTGTATWWGGVGVWALHLMLREQRTDAAGEG